MKIELKNYRAFSDENPAKWTLEDGFTAFVGVNNSGKSSLLRFFHEARESLRLLSAGPSVGRLVINGRRESVGFQSVADDHEVFHNGNERPMTATFRASAPRQDEPSAIRLIWGRDLQLGVEVEWEGRVVKARNIQSWPIINFERGSRRLPLDLRRYADAFADYANSIYLGPFRNAVNVGGQDSYYDLEIGERFIARWDEIKTGNNRDRNRSALSVQEELREIFGLDRLEINASPGNQTMQVFADDQPYQLQEQGSGFAQFVVAMAYVATQKPAFILIDEPELNLHPSLQLDFLTILAKYSTRGVVFASHSIGLARAVGQRVYTVLRDSDGKREVRELSATRDYAQFLGELSYSGYTALGFNRILLVEGPTEVPAVQAWLRLYGLEHKVVLMPLGGGSLINASSASMLGEVSRITKNVSVLIDSERQEAGEDLAADRAAFVDNCIDLGFQVHVLERRALENYLPDEAIKKVKGEKYRQLGEFEARAAVDPMWGKNENWRIASEMDRSSLEANDLGAFLTSLERLVNSEDCKRSPERD